MVFYKAVDYLKVQFKDVHMAILRLRVRFDTTQRNLDKQQQTTSGTLWSALSSVDLNKKYYLLLSIITSTQILIRDGGECYG